MSSSAFVTMYSNMCDEGTKSVLSIYFVLCLGFFISFDRYYLFPFSSNDNYKNVREGHHGTMERDCVSANLGYANLKCVWPWTCFLASLQLNFLQLWNTVGVTYFSICLGDCDGGL